MALDFNRIFPTEDYFSPNEAEVDLKLASESLNQTRAFNCSLTIKNRWCSCINTWM